LVDQALALKTAVTTMIMMINEEMEREEERDPGLKYGKP
jgi:hypothetical protein